MYQKERESRLERDLDFCFSLITINSIDCKKEITHTIEIRANNSTSNLFSFMA